MSKQERYFLFDIEYHQGEFTFTEYYVIQAESEFEAQMRVAHGLKTWYVSDGIEPDDGGVHHNAEVMYYGDVQQEVSWQFADECPVEMKMFAFGSDYQPNLKDIAAKTISDNELTYAEHVEAKEAQA